MQEDATELFIAAVHGLTDDVTALLADGSDVNETSGAKGFTPLYVACLHGEAASAAVILSWW